jgi:hypothetical protein
MHFSVADLMQTFHTANISDMAVIFLSGYRDIPPAIEIYLHHSNPKFSI